MSPLSSYQHKLDQQDVLFDLHQQPALYELERVYQLLVSNPSSADGVKSIQGVYLWGDVGRGKTFLMDLFYDCLPDDVGLRLHFHHFMARLHRELNLAFGQKNPLKGIAKRLASECRVLCFDEFFVSDHGEAMLLG